MNKISKYMSFAAMGLMMASCGDDYNDWANPQTNPQEDAITIPGFTATAAQAIDFNSLEADSVNTFSLSTAALPDGFSLADARIVLTPQGVDGATATSFNTSLDGKAAVAELAQYTEDIYGKRPAARTFDAQVYVDAVSNGQAVLINAGKINVTMTPKAPFIDAGGYYLTGDMTGAWDTDHLIKFNHSGADVYEDPVFTMVITTTADNQYWKIIPQSNLDNGNMWADGVLGTAVNGDASLEGRLTTNDPQAGMIEKAGTYQFSLNMMDYTYTIKALAPEYYLVGALQGWSDSNMSCLMYAQSATTQSYTTQWNAGANLKIWGASDFGNWNAAYGTAVDSDNSAAGSLVVNGGAIVCPEPGSVYTFTVDFANMTYKWTKLDNQSPAEFEVVGLIGTGIGGWGDTDDVEMTQVTPHNWYVETQIADGGIKIRANHSWSAGGNWGLGDGQEYNNKGTFVNDGGSGNVSVPAGKYKVFFNDITGEYAFIAE